MNHSMEDDMDYEPQKPPAGNGFLEDQDARNSMGYYEYDYDHHHDGGMNGHLPHELDGVHEPLPIKHGKKFAEDGFDGVDDLQQQQYNSNSFNLEDNHNVTPRQARKYVQEPDPEVGILFFCMCESKPKEFINFVITAKIVDLVIYFLTYGLIAIYIQVAFSGCFWLIKSRINARKSTHMLIKFMFYLMVLQNFYISVVFMINLIKSSNDSQPLYIFYLVVVYFVWITQNIAWDFQLMENSGLFLDIETDSQGVVGNESTQIKSKEFPSGDQPTKTKLKRRTPSSLNNSVNGI